MPTIQTTKRMYEFIKRVIQSTGQPPTIAELCRQFDMRSTASVYHHIKTMQKLGWITIIPHVSRGIRLVEQENKAA